LDKRRNQNLAVTCLDEMKKPSHDFMMRSVIGEYRKENSQLSTE